MRVSQSGKTIGKVLRIVSAHFFRISGIASSTMTSGKLYERDVWPRNESVCLPPLVGCERILAVESNKPHILSMSDSLVTCDICFNKPHFVKLHLLRAFTIEKMHFEPAKEEPTVDEEAEEFQPDYFFPTETPVATSQGRELSQGQAAFEGQQSQNSCSDDYHCECVSCQNKYGSLPVLLQGIEEKYESGSQPSTSSGIASRARPSGRALSCRFCAKLFTHRGDFNKHLRKHTREKPFSCPVCDRKFSHTSNLLRHQRLHSGDKPFVCENCDKSFSRKDKLDSHRRSRSCQESSR